MSSNKTSKKKLFSSITSLFSRKSLNKTPLESLKKVKIDSFLISIGLLSQHFGNSDSVGHAFWKTSHQLFVHLLQWFMFIKWIFCASMADSDLPSHMMGDFTAYLPGHRFDYHFLLIFWSSIGAFSCSLFKTAKDHHKMNLLWLKAFELCKGSVKHQDMKLGVEEAVDFWQRVVHTIWISKALIRILFLITSGSVIAVLVYLWPKEHLYRTGVVWTVVTIVWLYYLISIQIGVMAVFHVLCYYFIAKFRRLNESIKELETNRSDLMSMHHKINTYMTHHNSFSQDLVTYNRFWQYYILLKFVVYITIICFIVELILFSKMVFLFKMVLFGAIFGVLLCLAFIAFSACAISEELHDSYGPLNGVSQNYMPILLKTQLQIYIQRIGGPTIGFSCWDLFTLTYDAFFQTLLMIASFFVLFMDVSQSERQKRNVVLNEDINSVKLTSNTTE